MRTMFDSTTPAAIHPDAQIVAGYLDGLYAWSAADWARFPNAVKVGIVISAAHNAGDVLDIETGDATPEQAPAWVRMRQAAGIAVPTLYCNYSTWPAVQRAVGGLTVDYWIARYNGVPELIPGSAATQYADGPMMGYNVDASVCADWWPRSAPHPQPQPTEDDMSTPASVAFKGLNFEFVVIGDRSAWMTSYPPGTPYPSAGWVKMPPSAFASGLTASVTPDGYLAVRGVGVDGYLYRSYSGDGINFSDWEKGRGHV